MGAETLAEVKSRMRAEEQAPAAPAPTVRDKAPLSDETREQLRNYEDEVRRQESEGRVDLGPIPQAALDNMESDDTTLYRGTASDNPEVRKAIESRCSEMDFGDLVITNRVQQHVPILPGKVEPVFQSMVGTEQYWLEKNIHLHGETPFSMKTWVGYGRLVFSLISLNGQKYDGCLDKEGEVVEDLFTAKFKRVMALPDKFLELLLLNLGWFSDRVERLYKDDFIVLKNG